MTARFQDAALVASPSYPDAISWSQENLIAVASGHIVTILNPALPSGPRGLIAIPNKEPYQFGIVKREDLLTARLLPTCLNRDRRPCARSISWSHLGMAPNFGCLLAVCTAEGHVKIYRPPFCDFGAEWIEIMDITHMLYDYLSIINFGEAGSPYMELSVEQASQHEHLDENHNFALKKHKRRKTNKAANINQFVEISREQLPCSDDQLLISTQTNGAEIFALETATLEKTLHPVIVTMSKVQEKAADKTPGTHPPPLISPDEYASRDAMLSSLVVAWSPLLKLSSESLLVTPNSRSDCFSLLAVGAKSGGISIWKIYAPECYQIEHSNVSTTVMLVGLLQAHCSWVTTLSWVLLDADSSNPQLLLVTGSFDGSVNIWMSYAKELQKSSELNNPVFSPLKQVVAVNHVPVSVLSSIAPVQSLQKVILAIGRTSGSLEVWTCDLSSRKFEMSASCAAHDQVVTGLAWGFGGCCLYSCGQDNFMHSWTVHGNSLTEVPISSSTPGPRSSSDLPDAFLSCLGVAISPGKLAVAVVRSFNIDLLDQMYQARIQKAAVEFLWNSSQQCNLSKNSLENSTKAFPGFPEKDLAYWESNILWSLKQYEDVNNPLVVWDIVAALLTFKHSIPEYVEHTVTKWLSLTYLGSSANTATEKVLLHVSQSLSEATSRQLHLLNVVCRSVMLSEVKADELNTKLQNLRTHNDEDEPLRLWLGLLQKSESELRERLVGYSLSFALVITSKAAADASHNWYPSGLAQMVQWVELTNNHAHDQLKCLTSEIKSQAKRSNRPEYTAEEKCCYCSSLVALVSPDVAFCQGSEHRLERCAVSMQVCPTTPLWFCKCCHRWTVKLPPETLFAMRSCPSDFKSLAESDAVNVTTKPFCPFCGVLLQRLQPEFLLSASPV